MSMVDDDEPVEADGSIDPQRLIGEVSRQFETTARYALRQGLSADELKLLVDKATTSVEYETEPLAIPDGYQLVKLPSLLDKGVNDVRGKQ